MNNKSYFNKLLVLDFESSGLAFNSDNPSYDPVTHERYQPVSVGLIVVNADTLAPIEKLYLEIQWDGKSTWSDQAERIHGLSKLYLADNGVTTTEAVELIGNLVLKYWGPTVPINVCGHNVNFDICFLRQLMRSEGIEVKISNRVIDTNSIGFAVFGTYDSNELFSLVAGKERDKKHNALEDAELSLKVLKTVRTLANTWL